MVEELEHDIFDPIETEQEEKNAAILKHMPVRERWDSQMSRRAEVSVSSTEVIKLFSCSTQLSMEFQLLIKIKCLQMKEFLAISLSDVVFILLINVKMPTIVGILTFMSRTNFVLS